MGILTRLKEIIEIKYKGNQSKMCRDIDYSPSSLSNLIKRDGIPSSIVISKLLEKHRDISPYWLLLGEGDVFQENEAPKGESDSRQEVAGLRKEIEYLKESNGQLKEINHLLKRQLEDLNSPSE